MPAGNVEKIQVLVRPALRAFYGEFAVFLVSFIGARVLFVGLPAIEKNMGVQIYASFTRWLTVLVPLVVALDIMRRYLNNLYVLRRRNIVQLKGRLSFKLRKNMVRYADIRKIDLKQSILGRLLGYGTIRLYTAATTHAEIHLSGIAKPLEIMHQIDKLRERCLLELSSENKKSPLV